MSAEDKRKSIRIKNSKRGGREGEMGEGPRMKQKDMKHMTEETLNN